MFGRTIVLGYGALGLGPSQIIKLNVLIWTDYFIHWLAHSTNFFQVLDAHGNLWQLAVDTQGITQLSHWLLTIEKEEVLPMSCVMVFICHREITTSSVCFDICQGARFFLQDLILIKVSNISLCSVNSHWLGLTMTSTCYCGLSVR